MYTVLVFLPLVTLIVLAITTKNMAGSMTAAVFIAMLLLYKEHILNGTIDSFYATLTDSSFQFCLILIVLFGGIIELFQQSGALQGFADLISRYAKSRRQVLVLAWILSVAMFVDEYLNSIAVSFSMRDISDRNKIPREHLAFQANAMACCLCAVVPFTSWIGFSLGLVKDYGIDFAGYAKAIPFMFYPILMMLICLLLALGALPKIGNLRKAYKRVQDGGPAFFEEKGEKLVELGSSDDVKPSSALNALIPIGVLIGGVLVCDNDLVHGLILALVCQFIMYVPQRIMSIPKFFEIFFTGVKGLTSILIIVFLGFTLSKANEALGFFDIVIGGAEKAVPPSLIPLMAFILTGFCVFAIGGCWVVMLITMPVFVPMAIAVGASVPLTFAAVMSGVCLGYSLCFYADVVFMCMAGTGVANITIIKTSAPYSAVAGVLAAVGFLICGMVL